MIRHQVQGQSSDMLPFPAYVVFRNVEILSLAVKGAASAQNCCCLNITMYHVKVQGENACRTANKFCPQTKYEKQDQTFLCCWDSMQFLHLQIKDGLKCDTATC